MILNYKDSMNPVITRFAPSPTGNLHIGSARTALINYIITKQEKLKNPSSKFLLRIEDTDKKRSKKEYQENIINNMEWLGIKHDDSINIQSTNILRHQEIAFKLLEMKKAFKCICSPELLEKKREENRTKKIINKHLCSQCENNLKIQSLKKGYVIRLKIPLEGEISINDKIQGIVKVQNKEIDDFIILRKDKTPTYLLSVVVDDFDMNVNLVIRGDDHLNNTFRQIHIYKNLNWLIPNYAHLPLIHGEDGKKLSKRHGAVDLQEFKNKGYLKDSIINNLILLGWSPGKENEIIQLDEVLKIFNIESISKSSSIFNYDKLNFFNNHYLKKEDNFDEFIKFVNNDLILKKYMDKDKKKLFNIFLIYKNKIYFYKELENICEYYFDEKYYTKKNKLLESQFKLLIIEFNNNLESIHEWNANILEKEIKNFIIKKKIKFISFGKPLRLLLINLENGPSISDILFILGKKSSIKRIKDYIKDK